MTGIYPADDRIFRPWKNGGGQTAEILCWPDGAGFDDFTLRLSTARVDSSGPFSDFAGIDRVLTVIEGGPMRLCVGGQSHSLAMAQPFAFAGDLPCAAEVDAPLLDFNVMTRRPLAARVWTGPLHPRARFALLLQPYAGLRRLDLIDLQMTTPDMLRAVTGALSVMVQLSDPKG